MRNLHVPLPEPVHRRLREQAMQSGQPATVLARQAIETWLEERRRMAVHEAVAEYARQEAGSGADLDGALEAAGVERLLEDEKEDQ